MLPLPCRLWEWISPSRSFDQPLAARGEFIYAGSGRDIYIPNRTGRGRDWRAILTKTFKVKLDGLADFPFDFVDSGSGSDASGKVRNIGRVIRSGVFDNDRVAHGSPHFPSPACFRMLFSVPGANSSLGLPGTVTRPGLIGCLNWRWLPFIATSAQPSSASKRSISLTFTRGIMRRLGRPAQIAA